MAEGSHNTPSRTLRCHIASGHIAAICSLQHVEVRIRVPDALGSACKTHMPSQAADPSISACHVLKEVLWRQVERTLRLRLLLLRRELVVLRHPAWVIIRGWVQGAALHAPDVAWRH